MATERVGKVVEGVIEVPDLKELPWPRPGDSAGLRALRQLAIDKQWGTGLFLKG